MEKKIITRNPGLDIVRVFALFCVVSVHFFLHSGFYNIFVRGGRMYVAMLMRSFFMICVPLFIVLSGYLMRGKKPCKKYYVKITRILVEYVLASLCYAAFTVIRHGAPDDIFLFCRNLIINIISIRTRYSWYVEMYVGLFLLVPYLNVVYNTLGDQKAKQKLILTMLLLTAFPPAVNSFVTSAIGTEPQLQLLPQWWIGFYPITYYYIGAYLSEYPLQISQRKNLLFIVITGVVTGSLTFWQNHGMCFNWGSMDGYDSVLTVVQTVLVFSFLSRIPCKPNGMMAKSFAHLSDCSFCAYLLSAIFDDIFYQITGWFEGQYVYRLELYVVVVPMVFVCALTLSTLVQTCLSMGRRIVQTVSCRKQKKELTNL